MKISYSAPGKIHILGEHSVVYGKPALLAAINLRVKTTISNFSQDYLSTEDSLEEKMKKIIEPIIKRHLKLKNLPNYSLSIDCKIPIGAGLGSSASISASYFASLLTFLKIKWDLNLINDLTFQSEKIFHGNPSGADNAIVIYGGLIWFRKETDDLKIIHQLPFSISNKLSKNFVLINTGIPKESTSQMVTSVKTLFRKKPATVYKFLSNQEILTKEILENLKLKNIKKIISDFKMAEYNLEHIGVVSNKVLPVIRKIESVGGAAKISGAGGIKNASGFLVAIHSDPKKLIKIARENNFEYFQTLFGVEGLRKE